MPYPGYLSLTGSEEPISLGVKNQISQNLITEDFSVKTPLANSGETPTIGSEENLKTQSNEELDSPGL